MAEDQYPWNVRLDGWQNSVTKLGTSSDKNWYTTFGINKAVTTDQLQALYDADWLAARVVDSLVSWSLRKGFETDAEDAQRRFLELNHTIRYPKGVLQFALKMGRLEGGCGILLGLSGPGGDPENPPGENAELVWLDIVRREDLRPSDVEMDMNSPEFGLAQVYEIQGDHPRRGYRFHADRMLWCEGKELASDEKYPWIGDYNNQTGMPYWGSVLQPVWDTIARYGMSWASVSTMIQEASIAVFKMKGVFRLISQGDQTTIDNRFLALNQGRSVANCVLLDSEGEEEYERTAVSFTDLPDLLSQLMNNVSGAAEIPGMVLFGFSPSGMNATGENDLGQWYDRVTEYQENAVTPKLKALLTWCGAPEEFSLEFPEFGEPSAKEAAEIDSKTAATDRTYWDMGVVTEGEIRKVRGPDVFGLTEAEAAKVPEVEEPDPAPTVNPFEANDEPPVEPEPEDDENE
jgi:phage-related protein (TIGR01555 family)